jgi:hypothetical protein
VKQLTAATGLIGPLKYIFFTSPVNSYLLPIFVLRSSRENPAKPLGWTDDVSNWEGNSKIKFV